MQAARAAALRDSRRPPPDSFSFTETVQWDAKTFQLPKKLQAKASAPDKNQFLTATLNGVRAANATPATKLAVLNSRFAYHTLTQEVNASLKAILNWSTDQESPSIVVTNNRQASRTSFDRCHSVDCLLLLFPAHGQHWKRLRRSSRRVQGREFVRGRFHCHYSFATRCNKQCKLSFTTPLAHDGHPSQSQQHSTNSSSHFRISSCSWNTQEARTVCLCYT